MKTKLADRNLYIPFSLAAHALGIRKTRLINWFIRDSVHLDADRDRAYGFHRRLSRLDLVRLGFVARLTTLGITAYQASEAFEKLLPLRYEKRSLEQEPESELLELLRRSVLTISRLGGGSETIWMIDGKIGSKQGDNTGIEIEDDTSITIDIGSMMKKQDRRLNAAIRSGFKQRKR
jgi:hypothetical protein